MDPIQTLINALVVGLVGLVLARLTHNFRAEVKADIGDLRAEMRDIRAELREVRSDLTRVALAVSADPRPGRQQSS